MRTLLAGVGAVLAATTLAGCGGGSSSSSTSNGAGAGAGAAHKPAVVAGSQIKLTSPAFAAGATIPKAYTCDGADTPLPLRWSGIPKGARELMLVMRDPNAPGGNFVHWAVAAIPPAATALPASGTAEGRNSFGTIGYRGPCPPRGAKPHTYVITLSALAGPSGLKTGFSADRLRAAALALGVLTGTYGRR